MADITQLKSVVDGLSNSAKQDFEVQRNKADRLKKIQNEIEVYGYLKKKYEVIPEIPETVEDLIALDQFQFLDKFDQKFDIEITQILHKYRSQIQAIANEKLKAEQANLIKARFANDVKTYLTDINNKAALDAFVEADSVVRLGVMPESMKVVSDSVQP